MLWILSRDLDLLNDGFKIWTFIKHNSYSVLTTYTSQIMLIFPVPDPSIILHFDSELITYIFYQCTTYITYYFTLICCLIEKNLRVSSNLKCCGIFVVCIGILFIDLKSRTLLSFSFELINYVHFWFVSSFDPNARLGWAKCQRLLTFRTRNNDSKQTKCHNLSTTFYDVSVAM